MFNMIECEVCKDGVKVEGKPYKKGDVVEVIEPDAFYYCTATGLLAVSRPQVIRGTRLVPPVWFKKKTEQKPVKKEVAKKVKKDNADS